MITISLATDIRVSNYVQNRQLITDPSVEPLISKKKKKRFVNSLTAYLHSMDAANVEAGTSAMGIVNQAKGGRALLHADHTH